MFTIDGHVMYTPRHYAETGLLIITSLVVGF